MIVEVKIFGENTIMIRNKRFITIDFKWQQTRYNKQLVDQALTTGKTGPFPGCQPFVPSSLVGGMGRNFHPEYVVTDL